MEDEYDILAEREMIDELRRRGFRVHVTRHVTSQPPSRYCCRICNEQTDLTYYGDTKKDVLVQAIEALSQDAA